MGGSRFRAVPEAAVREVPRGRNDQPGARQGAADEQSNQENKHQIHGSLKEWTTDHELASNWACPLSTRGSRAGKMQRLSVQSIDGVGQLRSGR